MENRANQIMNLLYKKGSIRVEELVELMGVSSITIRRDLKDMEDKGLLVRFRGGAMLPSASTYGHEPTLIERETKNMERKSLIAETAVQLINPGEVVVIDLGTTGIEIAKALRSKSNITVFTASLPVANILMNTKIKVFLFGGLVQGKEKCLGGSIARITIAQYFFDKFFLGARGISQDYGITDFGMDEVEIKKDIIKHSREVISVMDSSKFEKNAFIQIIDLADVDQVITDSALDSLTKQKYEKGGIKLIMAGGEN